MIKVMYGTAKEYEGYLKPEIVNINEKLDLVIYKTVDKELSNLVGLVRKDEFDMFAPFLLTKETFWAIANELEIRGIT